MNEIMKAFNDELQRQTDACITNEKLLVAVVLDALTNEIQSSSDSEDEWEAGYNCGVKRVRNRVQGIVNELKEVN